MSDPVRELDTLPGQPERRDRSVWGRIWTFAKAFRSLGRPGVVMLALGGLIVGACLLSLNLGFIRIGPVEVVQTFLGNGPPKNAILRDGYRNAQVLSLR